MRMSPKLISVLLVLFPSVVIAAHTKPFPIEISKAVADGSRPRTDVAADTNCKPAETLAFAGVKPGMVVGEFFPGGATTHAC